METSRPGITVTGPSRPEGSSGESELYSEILAHVMRFASGSFWSPISRFGQTISSGSGQGWKCVNRDIFVIIQDGFRLRESERHLPAASDLPLSPDHFLH